MGLNYSTESGFILEKYTPPPKKNQDQKKEKNTLPLEALS